MIRTLPTEVVTLLFPLRVPGGEIRKLTMRPLSDGDIAACDEGRASAIETIARAAGLAPKLGMSLSDVDLDRLAAASDRLRVRAAA
jgi:hypothetical protein